MGRGSILWYFGINWSGAPGTFSTGYPQPVDKGGVYPQALVDKGRLSTGLVHKLWITSELSTGERVFGCG